MRMADNDVIAENEKWRKERHERLLDPKGWLTLAGITGTTGREGMSIMSRLHFFCRELGTSYHRFILHFS